MLSTLALLSPLLACTQSPQRGEGTVMSLGLEAQLPAAEALAAADTDGDGEDTLYRFAGGTLSWGEGQSAELGGTWQAWARGDIDGDGREELLVATGVGRADRSAPVRIWSVDDEGTELLLEQAGGRAQVPDLRVIDGRIWVALFTQGTQVAGGWLVDGAVEPVHQGNLAVQQLPVGDQVVVGRIYGDTPKSDGDLKVHGAQVRDLGSFRGVRTLRAADLNGDGADELLVGDGWHYAYGQQAVARLGLFEGPDWRAQRTLTQLPGDYSIRDIQVMDGRILLVGTSSVHLLQPDALGWHDTVVGAVSEQGSAVFLRGAEPAIAVSGDPVRVFPLVP